MDICLTHVSEIEGIGPVIAESLHAIGIEQLVDLLLHPPSTLSENSAYSLEQFEKWRATALFLELDGMDMQLAEALVEIKVLDTEHLSIMDLDELIQQIHTALEDDRIEALPVAKELAALQVKAAKAFFGKQIQGKVTDPNGIPLESVEVMLGEYSTITNAKGIWRLHSLNIPDSVEIYFRKNGYESVSILNVQPHNDIFSTALLEQTMIPGVSELIVLDEFNGDDLGSFSNYKVQTVLSDESNLREGDLLRLTFIYSDGDLRFSSVYMTKVDQLLQVNSYRVSAGSAEYQPDLYSYWEFRNGKLTPSLVSDGSVLIHKASHKQRKRQRATGLKLSFEEAMGVPYQVKLD